jgi:hypothetical protein
MSPVITRITVDLPAPFSPTSAVTCPRFGAQSSDLTAVVVRNLFVTPSRTTGVSTFAMAEIVHAT